MRPPSRSHVDSCIVLLLCLALASGSVYAQQPSQPASEAAKKKSADKANPAKPNPAPENPPQATQAQPNSAPANPPQPNPTQAAPAPAANTPAVQKKAPKAAAPAPALKISPSSGAPGALITIEGTGFGTVTGFVNFNGIPVDVPDDDWGDTSIHVFVPEGLPAGTVTLTVVPDDKSKSKSKTANFTALAPPPKIFGKISGDFQPFIHHNRHYDVHVTLLNQDMQVVGQSVGDIPYTENELRMYYTLPDSKSVPVWALVGIQNPGDHLYPFTATKAPGADSSTKDFDEVISGDFCLSDIALPGGHCTTGLITVDLKGAIERGFPHPTQIKAVVQAADGTSVPAVLQSIGLSTARVTFTASSSFKPAWLILEGKLGAHKFAWAPAPPDVVTDLVYTADDLKLICTDRNCTTTKSSDLELIPIASDATATFVALQNRERPPKPRPDPSNDQNDEHKNIVVQNNADQNDVAQGDRYSFEEHLLVARVRAPMGLEPTAIQVINKSNNPPTSIVARRTIKPEQVASILNVDMSIMDQTTVLRNYGQRIAKRYLAVTLDVKNPTAKKLQFNKSALYFDVDYVDAEKRHYDFTDFVYSMGDAALLDMRDPNPYKAEFTEGKNPRRFRFGLEQNVRQAPVNYLSALGSFDATTEATGKKFDTVQLLASLMNTIATGGIAGSVEFRSASALLSGTFLPGLKGIILNDSHINRLRTNLVTQTLQQIIEVPATQAVTTVVLLPRNGILAFHNAEVPVMIDKILDVHVIPEVVSEVNETPLVKDQCKVDYTKDQARQALGEPSAVTTNADGTSVFTFPPGPVSTATFNAAGKLVSCQQRSNSDQLAQAKTLVEFNQILSRLSLSGTQINLTDQSVVVVDIPGVQQSFHFDSKGNKANDYTFLFSQIKTYEKGPKAALEAFLEKSGTALSPAAAAAIKTAIDAEPAEQKKTPLKAGSTVKYPSPDIQGGYIIATMKDATTIDTITFDGSKPASQK